MLSAFIREQAHCMGCQGKLTVLYNNERGGKIHFSSGMTLPASRAAHVSVDQQETSQLEMRGKYKNESKLHL